MKTTRVFKAIDQSAKSPHTLRTAYRIARSYGWNGFWKAVKNRADGRLALDGLDSDAPAPWVTVQQPASHAAQNAPSAPQPRIDYDTIGRAILKEQQEAYCAKEYPERVSQLTAKPLISIVMPMYNAPIKWLIKAIESVQSQYYPHWELCIVDDGSKDKRAVHLVERLSQKDARIRLHILEDNGGISAASNKAVEMSCGDYIALLDQDDEMAPEALFYVVSELNKHPEADFIYTDECKVDAGDRPVYSDFFFKPDWSPEFMINFMYTGHLTVYKKTLVQDVLGFRSAYDFSQDYDLALRASEKAKHIIHIERVLYFRRKLPPSGAANGKALSHNASILSLMDYYKEKGHEVHIAEHMGGRHAIARRERLQKVSIIVPTDHEGHIKSLITALVKDTAYANYEIILVVNSLLAQTTLADYPHYRRFISVCAYDGVFNFSDKCNQGAKAADGEVLVFLNDDALPLSRDWLERLLDVLELPGVGGVSPAMVYPDLDRVQYAGIQVGQPVCGICGPSFHLQSFTDVSGRVVTPRQIRDVSVLSGACMAITKDVFNAVGGFDAVHTPNGHSDVDISFRIAQKGLRCVYTPASTFVHPGLGTWTTLGIRDKANLYLLKNWPDRLQKDPYFTASMRRYAQGEMDVAYELLIPEVYHPKGQDKGDILLVSHEMSRTGAPVVLLQAAKVLKDNGYYVVVVTPVKGPMVDDFLKAGMVVIIDPSFANFRWYPPHDVPASLATGVSGLVHDFDLVFVNTMVGHNFINCYNNTKLPLVWWLHEGWASYQGNSNPNETVLKAPFYLPKRLGNNVKAYCGGLYALEMQQKFHLDYDAGILLYGVDDWAIKYPSQPNAKIRFVFPASYEVRKNQMLLVKAIALLTQGIRDRAEFFFIGGVADAKVYTDLQSAAAPFSCITIMKPIPYETLLDIYTKTTCIVVPSIDDPMPVVLTEAMMLSKVVLCSNMTGTSRYIQDGQNGFVFDCNDEKELAEKITYIIQNDKKLGALRAAGRKTYEEIFTMAIFERDLLKVIEANIVRFEG